MRYHEKNCLVSLTTWLVLLSLQIHTQAGPVKHRSSRTIREVYPEVEPEKDVSQAQVCIVGDVVYGMDEMVPAEQPCLKCKCQPPGVQCETTRCVKKPGCRAIHKPNKCCPDYQCECEHNGRFYANGERLETSPGGECKVCYCRGGEVQCAEVTCYIRTDCEGRTVPGQCCPKYDHCPPKEPFLERSLSRPNGTYASTTQNTHRIVDLSKRFKENPEDNKITVDKADKGTQTDFVGFTSEPYLIPEVPNDSPKVVVQEVIPEIELVPVTTQINEEPHGHLIIEETTEAKNQISNHSGVVLPQEINDLVTADSDTEPSEVSEIYQHPPPVLRIGDKLLFLKKGELVPEKDVSTPIPVITIIGAEGLQRGFEESGEIYIDPNNSSKDYENQSNDLEASGTSSSHILSLVKFRNNKINEQRTAETEIYEEPTTVTTPEISDGDLENFDFNSTFDLENVTIEDEFTTQPLLSTTEMVSNTTEPITKIPKTTKTEEEVIVEQNPAYPPIPDDMGPQSETLEQEQDHINQLGKETPKILPEILEIRNNKTIPQNTTNWEWLKNESLINENAALPEDILNTTYYGDFEETTTEFGTKLTDTIEDVESATTTKRELGEINEKHQSGELPKLEGSPESLEDVTFETSKEVTTTKNTPPSLMSNENASVDTPKNSSPELTHALEKVEILSNLEESDEIGDNSGEIKEDTIKESSTKTLPIDVEIFDTKVPLKNTSEETTPKTGGGYETKMKPKPERIIKETKAVKRQNSAEDEAREVFRQLDEELKGAKTQRSLTKAEEEKEAERIFEELLQETTSTGDGKKPKPNSPQARNQETEILQRVSDAISKFQLRDSKQSLDTSILGILRDFFTSQYKSYEKNTK